MATGVALASLAYSIYSGVQQHKEAKAQRELQKEQSAEQERLAKIEAGKSKEPTSTEETVSKLNAQKSALRRTILTQNQQSSSKLGD